MSYPTNGMEMNFLDANIVEPYISYINCCMRFGNEPQLTLHEFNKLYPIMCFDVSSQPQLLKSNGINITLYIKKSSALTLLGYCLILEESHHTIDVLNGQMIRVN